MPFTNNTGRDLIAMIDREQQVLNLEMKPSQSPDLLVPVRKTSADGRVAEWEEGGRPRLFPSIASIPLPRPFASVATFAAKAKAFDDGLYAAVELLAERGTSAAAGRSDVVAFLFAALRHSGDRNAHVRALGALAAAVSLEAPDAIEEEDLRELAVSALDAAGPDILTKPVGFYTWTEELRAIFRKGRLLQRSVADESAAVLAAALETNAALRESYVRHLVLSASLTNPLVRPGLVPSPHVEGIGEAPAIYPASESHEGRLMKRLLGERSLPHGFQLLEELADQVTSGRLDLRPSGQSGWYDHQIFALEGLVVPERMPEATHLRFSNDYRLHLRKVFIGVFGLTRETHAKQLEMLVTGIRDIPDIVFSPTMTVEPMAEYYPRRAASYRFVQRALVEAFGESTLRSYPRLTERGPVDIPLLDELEAMAMLFTGAYLICCEETGLTPAVPLDDAARSAARSAAERWIANLAEDRDLATDNRCMVPLFYDVERRKTKVLAILGYEAATLEIAFVRRPDVKFRTREGKVVSGLRIEWESATRRVVRPVALECYVDAVLDRDEFRHVCDRHQAASAILRAIGEQE